MLTGLKIENIAVIESAELESERPDGRDGRR